VFSVRSCDLPEHALLQRYRESGAYTDCYVADIDREVSQADYVRAFYTTLPFRTERLILKWAISKPSTDKEADLLAEGRADKFAAWYVEAREGDQILLSDFREQTRSWLMTDTADGGTWLYFGSAVVKEVDTETGEARIGKSYSLLMGFHRLYSRILLSAARRIGRPSILLMRPENMPEWRMIT